MVAERSTRTVLTLIAVALWLLVLIQVQALVPTAEAQTGPVDVNIRGTSGLFLTCDGALIGETLMFSCQGTSPNP